MDKTHLDNLARLRLLDTEQSHLYLHYLAGSTDIMPRLRQIASERLSLLQDIQLIEESVLCNK